jgi:ABC-type Fe3+-siderophore transport system permease subunit
MSAWWCRIWFRLSFGSDNRLVIVGAALRAAFVIIADTVARTVIAPRELPVVRSRR